jgi:hypothetical protein
MDILSRDRHLERNSSTASAVSSYTLSNVPFTSRATLLIAGACRPARDSNSLAFVVATFFMTLTKPASFRSESPYSLRMCGLSQRVSKDEERDGRTNVLLDIAEEPPVRNVLDDRESEDELAPGDQSHTEERRSAQNLRVVKVAKTH